MTQGKYLKIILLTSLILFLVSQASAIEINTFDSEFSIEIIPNNPAPNEQIFAKTISYQFDIDRSNITWTLNGEIIAKGVGKKDASFLAPDFGKESRLVVSIITDKGISISKTLSFVGNDIDLLWEAETSVPAWYKSKALPAFKSLVKITAIPHLFSGGAEITPSGLVYEWSVNYEKIPDASGANKNSFAFQINDHEKIPIGLRVSNKNKSANLEKYMDVSTDRTRPKIIFYGDNPLEGPDFGNALEVETNLSSKEMAIRAEPYFFANPPVGGLSYSWTMNDQEINPDAFPNVLSLRTSGEPGSSIIGLKIRGAFQSAEKFIKINF
ncbi:MAG: hypothetical protein AAB484_03215 [Patescibacteria group bacterium]